VVCRSTVLFLELWGFGLFRLRLTIIGFGLLRRESERFHCGEWVVACLFAWFLGLEVEFLFLLLFIPIYLVTQTPLLHISHN
jgi:hypothetical protein